MPLPPPPSRLKTKITNSQKSQKGEKIKCMPPPPSRVKKITKNLQILKILTKSEKIKPTSPSPFNSKKSNNKKITNTKKINKK
jgi:hypothetical protein